MPSPTVVIIGASGDRTKFGNKSVRAHALAGYEVFPVNPKGGLIEGLKTYVSIEEIAEESFDRCSLYVPPSVGLDLLPSIAAKGCRELWLNPGTASAELVDAAKELGLVVVEDCSIVALGLSPTDFP